MPRPRLTTRTWHLPKGSFSERPPTFPDKNMLNQASLASGISQKTGCASKGPPAWFRQICRVTLKDVYALKVEASLSTNAESPLCTNTGEEELITRIFPRISYPQNSFCRRLPIFLLARLAIGFFSLHQRLRSVFECWLFDVCTASQCFSWCMVRLM